MPLPPEENIVRAICTDAYDRDRDRISASLFKGENTSVSRLAIIPLTDHWDMFRRHIEKPPQRQLLMIGEINVQKLREIGLGHEQRTELTVEPRPESWNKAHAEIPQKITRGLSNRIVNALKRHLQPEKFPAKSLPE